MPAKTSTSARTRLRVSELNLLLPSVEPIIPPATAATIHNQTSDDNSIAWRKFPASPDIELTRINIADTPAAVLVSDHLANKRTGVRKMPPPTPTSPDNSPITAPINRAQTMGGCRTSSSPFRFIAKRNAAKINTAPRTI